MSDALLTRRASPRRTRLVFAAAATLALTLWAALQPDEPSPEPTRPRTDSASRGDSTPRAGRPAAIAAPTPNAGWPEAPRAGARPAWPALDAKSTAAWSGPPVVARTAAAAASAVTPAAAQAPPFTYVLIGRLDDGEPRALLSGQRRSLGAKAADLIDGDWRVDAVTPQGVTLTWLPGGIKKTITFGSL
ncbi:MAG: hypothetical protein ACSLE9_13335 [Burkholderiaceae bacterium]